MNQGGLAPRHVIDRLKRCCGRSSPSDRDQDFQGLVLQRRRGSQQRGTQPGGAPCRGLALVTATRTRRIEDRAAPGLGGGVPAGTPMSSPGRVLVMRVCVRVRRGVRARTGNDRRRKYGRDKHDCDVATPHAHVLSVVKKMHTLKLVRVNSTLERLDGLTISW